MTHTESREENINAPLMLHEPNEDEFVPKKQQAERHRALDGNDMVSIHDYVGQDHAFARVGGKHYDQASADLARGRTLDHFKAHLG